MSTATPSSEWLEAARARVNADPAFRARGTIDTRIALKVGDAAWLVTFAAFGCDAVQALPASDLRDADLTLAFTPEGWRQFVAGRAAGNGPTLAEVDLHGGIVQAASPRQRVQFLRYHTSIQAFVDAGIAAAAA